MTEDQKQWLIRAAEAELDGLGEALIVYKASGQAYAAKSIKCQQIIDEGRAAIEALEELAAHECPTLDDLMRCTCSNKDFRKNGGEHNSDCPQRMAGE